MFWMRHAWLCVLLLMIGCSAVSDGGVEESAENVNVGASAINPTMVFEPIPTTVGEPEQRNRLQIAAGAADNFWIPAGGDRYDLSLEGCPDREFHRITMAVLDPSWEPLMLASNGRLDWRGSRTTTGVFNITVTNAGSVAIDCEAVTRWTLPSNAQLTLDELLARLVAAGIDVEHGPSVQGTTEFDQLFGRNISDRELLYIQPDQTQLDVYIFQDETTADEAVATIQPGTVVIQRGSDRVDLDFVAGTVPLWWHFGRFIILATGPDLALEAQVSAVVGEPLGR